MTLFGFIWKSARDMQSCGPQQLEREVVEVLTSQIEERRNGGLTGEFSIKLVHREGKLVVVHYDDHQRRGVSDSTRRE